MSLPTYSKIDKPPATSFEDAASILSKTVLYYLNPIFNTGTERDIVISDLGPPSKQDQAVQLFNTFFKNWQEELKLSHEKRSLWMVLWRTVGFTKMWFGLFLYAANAAAQYGPVLILNSLVKNFEGLEPLPPSTLWIYVALMFVFPMVSSICTAQSNNVFSHIGIQFRNCLINMIYRKSLKLNPSSRQKQSTGMIVNMFSNDTKQLQFFMNFFASSAVAPLQIIVSLALIYLQVGPATFVGFGIMLLVVPFNLYIFTLLNRLRQRKVKKTDLRVKLMNEILSGIRVIKFYAWERAFQKNILAVRQEELVLLTQMAYVVAVGFTLVLQGLPCVQPILVFYTYIRLGNNLTSATAFTTISLFNLMQFPFAFLPLGLAQYSQSLVSMKRMLNFFISEELEPYVTHEDKGDNVVVRMDNLNVGWIKEEEASKPKEGVEISGIVAASGPKSQDDNKIVVAVSSTDGQVPTEKMIVEPGINRSVYTLRDMTIRIEKGQLVAVVGAVGSGKSSLLTALLGEMHLKSGSVNVVGKIAYCEQRSWILNATVQDNILFGEAMDQDRFDAAIYAASLGDDLRVLPGGVLTEIGERGINLSGGQKARVALARAVYKDCDVYLLDDPLSAVDAHVGQHIFNHCIRGSLKGKTRILVTHQLHFLPKCDVIIVLDNGKIKALGSYQELRQSGLDLGAHISSGSSSPVAEDDTKIGEMSSKTSKEEAIMSEDITSEDIPKDIESNPKEIVSEEEYKDIQDSSPTPITNDSGPRESVIGIAPSEMSGSEEARPIQPLSDEKKNTRTTIPDSPSDEAKAVAEFRRLDKRTSTIITVEERNTGDVESKVYLHYVRAGGLVLFSILITGLLCAQGAQIGAQFQLAAWGDLTATKEREGQTLSTSQTLYELQTYAWISMLAVAFIVVRALALAGHRIGTSTILHREVLDRIMKAPVAFFDVTPLGRILNRFSSDMLTIDEELNQTISQLSNSLFQCIGSIAAVAASTKGTFLILMIPIGYFYIMVQRKFRNANTAIARLEAISRSPIYTDFSQALVGAQSIRAYGEQARFIKRLEECLDINTIAGMIQQLGSQWLAIRLDFMGSCTTFFIALIAASTTDFIPPGYVALGLSYSFQVTAFLKFAVRMAAQFEAQMNSVERVKNYSERVVQEDEDNDRLVDPESIPAEWPSEGRIEGRNVQMAYRDGPLVLRGLDFSIKGAEKVGIAGRTGSGKSSMMIALFRIQDLALGSILIDDVDIATVPVQMLRARLGIIPQDPVMFSATVRFNLDPFTEHSDAEVWSILESVDMKAHVQSLPGKLEEPVAEGGDNFSAGQRQLVCIARALLRHPRILVLDEATASIDNDTDALVQRTIRASFKDATVLTIAHRLHTIIDSDRVMVLDAGVIAEIDKPEALLSRENSLFRSLWDRHQHNV